jgi:hypothetical protein
MEAGSKFGGFGLQDKDSILPGKLEANDIFDNIRGV